MRFQPKLGELIPLDAEEARDAIHVAVAPVIAGMRLNPGERVGFMNGDTTKVFSRSALDTKQVKITGIVDPYLTKPVKRGERIWMCLFPGTIESLRHDWSHPDFPSSEVQEGVVLSEEDKLTPREMLAHRFLAEFGKEFSPGMTYYGDGDTREEGHMSVEDLLEAMKQYVNSDGSEYVHLGYDTPNSAYTQKDQMWEAYEILTGKEVDDKIKAGGIFTCSC